MANRDIFNGIRAPSVAKWDTFNSIRTIGDGESGIVLNNLGIKTIAYWDTFNSIQTSTCKPGIPYI
ncbi:MAG: hypothetical protein ACHQIM_14395 [Sphingobacteriales bacterium]